MATKPSITDVKILFARSGNRCAFPKCAAPMSYNETLIGQVCHIKGDKPGSARYDAAQSDSERHAYGNLILLCPTHHTVIDEDEESYTVERVHKMKRDHEATATPVPDDLAEKVARFYVEQTVSTVGQYGGIAANIVNAQHITVASASNEPVTLKRQIQAIENLWEVLRRLRDECSGLILADNIFTQEEISDHFAHGSHQRAMRGLQPFASEAAFMQLGKRAGAFEADRERPFVSQNVWSIVFILRAVYGRAAVLIQWSYERNAFQNWRTDNGMDQLLRAALPAHLVEEAKKKTFGGLQFAIEHLEAQFLIEAEMRKA